VVVCRRQPSAKPAKKGRRQVRVNNTGHAVSKLAKGATVFVPVTGARTSLAVIVMTDRYEGPTDVMAADEAGMATCRRARTALTVNTRETTWKSHRFDWARLIILLTAIALAKPLVQQKAIRMRLQAGVRVRRDLTRRTRSGRTLGNPAERERGRQVMEQAGSVLRVPTLTICCEPSRCDPTSSTTVRAYVTDQMLDAVRPMPDAELRSLHLRDVADWLGLERVFGKTFGG
jgi:hypothetical protein